MRIVRLLLLLSLSPSMVGADEPPPIVAPPARSDGSQAIPLPQVNTFSVVPGGVFALSKEGSYYSSDLGNSWSLVRAEREADSLDRVAAWQDKLLGVSGQGEVVTTSTRPAQWNRLSALPSMQQYEFPSQLLVDGKVILIATSKGRAFRSTDGKSWKACALKVASPGFITELQVDRHGAIRLLMEMDQTTLMLESKDHGASWRQSKSFDASNCFWSEAAEGEDASCDEASYSQAGGKWEKHEMKFQKARWNPGLLLVDESKLTTNGGESWHKLPKNLPSHLLGFAVVGSVPSKSGTPAQNILLLSTTSPGIVRLPLP